MKRKKYAVIEEWIKKDVEPCLSYLVGGEAIVRCVTCNYPLICFAVSPSIAPSSSTQPLSKMIGLVMTQLEG